MQDPSAFFVTYPSTPKSLSMSALSRSLVAGMAPNGRQPISKNELGEFNQAGDHVHP
jgi:hypothetical protein